MAVLNLAESSEVSLVRRKAYSDQFLEEDRPDLREIELATCKFHIDHWISQWCYTCDPRDYRVYPFDPWPKQLEFLDWVQEMMRRQVRGCCKKNRDGGYSWLCCAVAVHGFLFRSNFVCGFGSRKLEYVDRLGDMKSLFEKCRFLLYGLPDWMMPRDFNRKRDDNSRRILNRSNGSSIVGEGGDSIGRGDRTSVYFVDEAQPYTSNVLTLSGWKKMGDVVVGDKVFGSNGKPCTVVGIRESGVHSIYRFKFSDGTAAECSPSHLWTVNQVWGKKCQKTLRAEYIAEHFVYHSPGGQKQYRYRLPQCPQVKFAPGGKLPVHPYLLGALIGDGTLGSSSIRLASADEEVVARVRSCLPDRYKILAEKRYSYRISHDAGRGARKSGCPLPLHDGLLEVGLKVCRSWEKFIPKAYLFSSVESRIQLLRGLMDTDGSGSGGRIAYHTCSGQLAEDVAFLVRSLGGLAYADVKPDARGYRDQHLVCIAMPEEVNPFFLSRKSQKVKKRKQQLAKSIVGVELLPPQPVRCIQVDSPDGLYVTDGFSLTHNCAFLEHAEMAETALSATANVRIDISSVNGPGTVFAQTWNRLPADQKFSSNWRDDPRKDDEWAEKKKMEIGEVAFASEYEGDESASVENIIIPAKWVTAAVNLMLTPPDGPWNVSEPDKERCQKCGGTGDSICEMPGEAVNPCYWCGGTGLVLLRGVRRWRGRDARAGFDVAEEGKDLCVIVCREGPIVLPEWITSWGKMDTTQSAWKARDWVEDWCLENLELVPDNRVQEQPEFVRRLTCNYDAQGPGCGIRGTWNNVEEPLLFDVCPLLASAAPSEREWPDGKTSREKFANLRAEGWWLLRKRFEKTYAWVMHRRHPDDPRWSKAAEMPLDELISIPDHAQLRADLSLLTYSQTETGKIKIQSKSEVTKSPDFGDALWMAFFEGPEKRTISIA